MKCECECGGECEHVSVSVSISEQGCVERHGDCESGSEGESECERDVSVRLSE